MNTNSEFIANLWFMVGAIGIGLHSPGMYILGFVIGLLYFGVFKMENNNE